MESDSKNAIADQDCAVCMQKLNHPAKLPCDHIFCFLCVKGVIIRSHKCPMCRTETPEDYLDNPVLVNEMGDEEETHAEAGVHQWYYEGKDGWWKYDERSNEDLEADYNAGKSECKLLLAGSVYCVDFTNMYQFRQTDPRRKRKVKRDSNKLPTKGIAGIRKLSTKPAEIIVIDDDTNTNVVDLTNNSDSSPENMDNVDAISDSLRFVSLEEEQ
ncbi:E3 ubiquitin-protein ligase rnf146 isoform X1 [Leptidea sinapis]|nr:E3 ubiquitin-protein ligase rnf146 isoform X1 [Leptidea sinapis]